MTGIILALIISSACYMGLGSVVAMMYLESTTCSGRTRREWLMLRDKYYVMHHAVELVISVCWPAYYLSMCARLAVKTTRYLLMDAKTVLKGAK
jgi:hypothetical protein